MVTLLLEIYKLYKLIRNKVYKARKITLFEIKFNKIDNENVRQMLFKQIKARVLSLMGSPFYMLAKLIQIHKRFEGNFIVFFRQIFGARSGGDHEWPFYGADD